MVDISLIVANSLSSDSCQFNPEFHMYPSNYTSPTKVFGGSQRRSNVMPSWKVSLLFSSSFFYFLNTFSPEYNLDPLF